MEIIDKLYYPYYLKNKYFVSESFEEVVQMAKTFPTSFYLTYHEKRYYSGMELKYLDNLIRRKKEEN